MPFCFEKTNFEGLFYIRPKIFKDDRGQFLETFKQEDFLANGITETFVQDNQSESLKGTLRGLHFQKKHAQAKIVRCIYGTVLDIAVDLRQSATFGKAYTHILSGAAQDMLFIPKGFAHGFLTLSDFSLFAYKCSDFYFPNDEGGIAWNSAEFLDLFADFQKNQFKISKKDAEFLPFDATKAYFNKAGNWIGAL